MDEKEYTIDVADMGKLLYENRKPIVKMTCIFVGIASIFLLIMAIFFPKYQSEAMLRIKQERTGSSLAAAMAGFTGGFLSMDSLQVESYVEILKSRSVVVPVIEATEEQDSNGKYPRYEEYIRSGIQIENVKMTDILQVKANAEIPEKAQKVNQLLIQGFLKRIAELNTSEKASLRIFLEDRLKTTREELNKAETAFDKFKVEHRIISADKNAEVFAERIAEAEKQRIANQIELEAAEARAAAINSQLYGSGASAADNVVLQQYNKQLAELESARIAYKEKYTAKHPKMADLEERIGQLKNKIQEEQAKIAALQAPSDNAVHQGLVAKKYSSEGALSVLRQKAESLQRAVDQNNAELEKLPEVQREYVKLARDVGVANEIFMMLTKKLEETKLTEHQSPNNVQVIDEPTLPDRRSFPRLKLSLIIAILFGLLISCGYVVLKELLNKTIRSTSDVKRFLALPVLGAIPDEALLSELTVEVQEPKELDWKDKLRDYIWKK